MIFLFQTSSVAIIQIECSAFLLDDPSFLFIFVLKEKKTIEEIYII